MRLQDVRVGDLRIAYATAGEGPPLVLLHGGWGDHRHWRRQLEGLSGDFAVAAWDTPGCGESSDPPGGWAMADYADCLAAWIDAAGIERPHVLGLSWGSTLALELYRRHPAVPSSLVLAGGYAGWAGSLPPEVVAERLARAEAELGRPPEEWAAAYIPGFHDRRCAARSRRRAPGDHGRRPSRGVATMLRAMAKADLRDVLPRIDVPDAADLRRARRALAAARRRGASTRASPGRSSSSCPAPGISRARSGRTSSTLRCGASCSSATRYLEVQPVDKLPSAEPSPTGSPREQANLVPRHVLAPPVPVPAIDLRLT